MDIKIITDSLSDIPLNIISEYDIEVIPLTIIFEDGEYKDGVDLSNEEFYEKLKNSSSIPKTSQVTPLQFESIFKNYLNENKKILYISGSSKATGTYQSSILAKNILGSDDIYIFDTMALSFGCGMLVVEAAKMARQGKEIDEILRKLEYMRDKVDHIFTVDTLEYLQKGGRISSTKAAIGTILNIKPILTVEEGLVSQLDQVRGKKKVVSKMIELAKERGNNLSDQVIVISHANNEELLLKLKEAVEVELKPKDIIISTIGATIGTHAGPGTVAMFYLR
ncbi:DegV family protein [Tepidibacter thalassicus]|uniref:EDD domain protein, DegV family n=1 Tax=Tepidibacter thalassicus DSM 15285 TaxID=1123350 RepID=A0A1M5RRA8_9FIRM|nr:DegV family protein [Tepidibacter thalassicus]SHH28729.1 EDD domain protein, DegV family [Tepidibacter thalassicus DSM 15285]